MPMTISLSPSSFYLSYWNSRVTLLKNWLNLNFNPATNFWWCLYLQYSTKSKSFHVAIRAICHLWGSPAMLLYTTPSSRSRHRRTMSQNHPWSSPKMQMPWVLFWRFCFNRSWASSAFKKGFADDSYIVHSDMHQAIDLQDISKVLIKGEFLIQNFS